LPECASRIRNTPKATARGVAGVSNWGARFMLTALGSPMKARRRISGASFASEELNDAKRLRKKAEQVRAIADKMTDLRHKQTMLEIAVCYVVLAQSADERDAIRRRD
jgi:hypothetical protein